MIRPLWVCGAAALVLGLALQATGDDRKDEGKDAEFLKKAASGGMMEVKVGKLAQEKATSPAIRRYGERLVKDHTKANEELKEVARAAGVTIPDDIMKKHQEHLEMLGKHTGDNFDRAFVKHAIEDHEKDIEEFSRAAKEAKHEAVREFARKSLPTLKEHLEMARQLQLALKP